MATPDEMVEVAFSVNSPDAPPEGAEQSTTILPPWADIPDNRTDAVERAVADYFDTNRWDYWFGSDEDMGTVIAIVSKPESIGGTYEIVLDRITRARVCRR